MIRYDRKTKCYTDGKGNYVHASVLRTYAKTNLGLGKDRGRLSRDTIGAYFLDVFNVRMKSHESCINLGIAVIVTGKQIGRAHV